MPFTWDLSEIRPEVREWMFDTPDETMRPEAWGIIQLMVGAGASRITEQNAPEVYARMRMMENFDAGGYFMRGPDGGIQLVTPENVQRLIGLRVNVGDVSRAAWLRRFGVDLDRLKGDYERDVRNRREADEAVTSA